jgi:branched-chain amino acid transport system ATP-binding protein
MRLSKTRQRLSHFGEEGRGDMLVLRDVQVSYRGIVTLLKGISLTVAEGQVVALLGANGAGKSLTLYAISGLLYGGLGDFTLSGTIEYDGERIDGKLPEEIVRMGIIQVMEGHRVLDDLTVNDNLLIGAHLCNRRSEVNMRLELAYQYFPELRQLQKRRAGYLSGGEQQMLVIARALMLRPKVMLLDEISLGLAPLVIRRIFEIVKRINAETKACILLAEQNVRAAFSIANFAYVMETGKVVLEGPVEKLKSDERIKQFYLGLSKSGQGIQKAKEDTLR